MKLDLRRSSSLFFCTGIRFLAEMISIVTGKSSPAGVSRSRRQPGKQTPRKRSDKCNMMRKANRRVESNAVCTKGDVLCLVSERL